MDLSIYISGLSLLVSIGALYMSAKSSALSNELKRDSNNIQMAAVELEIRQMIENAKKEMYHLASEMEQNPDKQVFIDRYESAKETYANAYDEACMKYLDGKIDKARFKNAYINEIRNIIEDANFEKLYREPQSRYKATIKVYKEWHDHER